MLFYTRLSGLSAQNVILYHFVSCFIINLLTYFVDVVHVLYIGDHYMHELKIFDDLLRNFVDLLDNFAVLLFIHIMYVWCFCDHFHTIGHEYNVQLHYHICSHEL